MGVITFQVAVIYREVNEDGGPFGGAQGVPVTGEAPPAAPGAPSLSMREHASLCSFQ
jgi:hypothetical protein